LRIAREKSNEEKQKNHSDASASKAVSPEEIKEVTNSLKLAAQQLEHQGFCSSVINPKEMEKTLKLGESS